MRVLHVIDSLAIGGAERMLVEIANCTAEDGHTVGVCVTRSEHPLARELRPEIALTVLHRRSRFDGPATRQFLQLLTEFQPEVIHLHGRSTFAFLTLLRMAGSVRAPLLFHDHHAPPKTDATPIGATAGKPMPLWFRLLARFAVSQYVGVHPGLGAAAQQAGIPEERVRVIGNCLDLSRLLRSSAKDVRTQLGVSPDLLVGLVVAGLRPPKGILPLIEAVARCEAARPFLILVAGGVRDQEYAERCHARIEELGVTERIRLLGERSDVPALMKSCNFAVVPSLYESGPLVLIEYLTVGLPVVYTHVGEVAQRAYSLGLPGGTAPDDIPALTSALETLFASSPELLETRAGLGRRIAAEHFDLRARMPQWYEAYRQAHTIS